MKKKELLSLTVNNTNKRFCPIINRKDGTITFAVDEGLPKPQKYLKDKDKERGEGLIHFFLDDKQIPQELYNVVASSVTDDILGMDSDVLYQCFITCYAEHRPLVLSPDVIWLIINQTLANHINANAEKWRHKIVDHDSYMDLIVQTDKDILTEKVDWEPLLEDFYTQIKDYTKGDIASTMRCDFSTTKANERIASIATLMNATKSYFHFHIVQMICGIPYITLTGTTEDWIAVREKTAILKNFDLSWWYEWLCPILQEFIDASQGKANQQFWQSAVLTAKDDETTFDRGGCIPSDTSIDGWFLALFPFKEGEKMDLTKSYADSSGESENVRADFNFIKMFPDGSMIETPMELWAGILGVTEGIDYALKPQIGWFVRKANQKAESLSRLRMQQKHRGIVLHIDTVPEILKELESIKKLELYFTHHVAIPDWMDAIDIENLEIHGEVSEEEIKSLKRRFSKTKLTINYRTDTDYIRAMAAINKEDYPEVFIENKEMPNEDILLFNSVVLYPYMSEDEQVFFENMRAKEEREYAPSEDLIIDAKKNEDRIFVVRHSFNEYKIGRMKKGYSECIYAHSLQETLDADLFVLLDEHTTFLDWLRDWSFKVINYNGNSNLNKQPN